MIIIIKLNICVLLLDLLCRSTFSRWHFFLLLLFLSDLCCVCWLGTFPDQLHITTHQSKSFAVGFSSSSSSSSLPSFSFPYFCFFLVYLYSLSSVLSFFWGFIHGLVYSYLICYFSQKCYSERDGLFSTYCAIYFQISTRTIIGVHICAQQRRRLEILSTFVTIVSKLSEDMCCWLRQRSPA